VARPVVLLSDYGLEDGFVGTCHAVIARISPESSVIDLTHSVPAHDIFRGALLLHDAVPYVPSDAVVFAVVDPGVGTSRRAIAVRTSFGLDLVGPDNGLLSLAWDAAGGVGSSVEITSSDVMLQPVSATFHGRDVFAPAAAHLARGANLDDLGPSVDPASLVSLELPRAEVVDDRVRATAIGVDRFGNIQLSARAADLPAEARIELRGPSGTALAHRVATFADVPVGELALVIDSWGWVAIVVNQGSAADLLRLAPGDAVELGADPGRST
jgi:S-adenosyl-L-methionine hydrolase (adenosine-forming)